MADLPSRQDIFDAGRRSLRLANNPRINPKMVDVQGSDINLLLGAGSTMGEEAIRAFARCLDGLFIARARGAALDRVAFDRTGLIRFDAVAASLTQRFSRPTAAAGAGTIPAGFVVETADGIQFATDVDVVFGGSDLQQDVACTALVAGLAGNVPINTVTRLAAATFDATIATTNVDDAAGGAEKEDDTTFRARALRFFVTIRRGVIGAIEYAALLVPGVAIAKAYEAINSSNALPAGLVSLVIGDEAGNAAPGMLQAVKDKLLEARAAGIPVVVTGGTVVNVEVEWRGLAYTTGINQHQAQEDVRAVTVAVAQFLNPGETLERAVLFAAAKTVPGVLVGSSSLVVPAGDTVPEQQTYIIRVRPQDVRFT